MKTSKQSPLEIYIRGYFKIKKTTTKADFDSFRRASVYIQEKIESVCCDDNDAVINLYTNKDTGFTIAVRSMLLNMPRKGNLQSLIRSKAIIDEYILSPCCANPSILTITGPTGTVNVLSDGEEEATYGASFTVTPKTKYLDEVVGVQLYINNVANTLDIISPFSFNYTSGNVPISGNLVVAYKFKIILRDGREFFTNSVSFTIHDTYTP